MNDIVFRTDGNPLPGTKQSVRNALIPSVPGLGAVGFLPNYMVRRGGVALILIAPNPFSHEAVAKALRGCLPMGIATVGPVHCSGYRWREFRSLDDFADWYEGETRYEVTVKSREGALVHTVQVEVLEVKSGQRKVLHADTFAFEGPTRLEDFRRAQKEVAEYLEGEGIEMKVEEVRVRFDPEVKIKL